MSSAIRSDAWAIRSSPPASSSPSSRPRRGRSRGPGARRCVAEQHLLDDRRAACRRRSRPRRSAGSSRACGSARCFISGSSPGSQRHAVVVDHDQRAVALDDRALGRRSRAARSGCSRGGCTARRRARSSSRAGRRGSISPLLLARVVQVPQLGPLVLRVPAVLRRCGTRRRAPWRGTSPRRGGRRRRPRRSRTCRAPASGPAVFMMSVCTAEPWSNGLMPCAERLRVDVDEQVEAELRGHAVAERDTSPGTSRSCRRAAAGRAAGRDRTPSAPGAASRRCPCRSSRASPGSRRPPRPRA